jgi:MoaA/NifB/PqqE/SkfB family radical SAM enzyme
VDIGAAISSLKLFGTGELSHPAYLIFFVTSRCVGKCRHCFYWESINKEESPLTLDEIEKVASSMGRLLQVTFTGGEPFMREDFPEIVEIFYRKNQVYHLGVATSGYHVDRVEAGVRRILESCGGSNVTVGLPIEGPPELNDEIRGVKGFYERTTETLTRLKAIKRAHPRLTILIDITASAFNRGRLIETYCHVRDELSPDNINLILTRGVPREEGARELDPDEVAKLLSLMEDDIKKGSISGYSFFGKLLHAKDVMLRRMALDIYRNDTYKLPCAAGRIAGVLMPEGEVYPCELWKEPIGNVRESGYDLSAVWTSEPARAARREIIDSKCTCYHQCFLSNTIFFNLGAWPGMIRELMKILT